MRRTRLGTNQYQDKYDNRNMKFWLTFLAICFLIIFATRVSLTYAVEETKNYIEEQFTQELLIPVLSEDPIASVSMKVMPKKVDVKKDSKKNTQYEEIDAEIKRVFGEDYDKAKKVLSCENSSLNPDAVNTAGNYPPGSRDIGVFQINEYWQATQGKFLFNWKINIQIAHQLFMENGKQFNLWTCGRRLGL